jgi:twitching motility protein PilT
MDKETLHKILSLSIEKGISDIHFRAGSAPLFRAAGFLVEVKYRSLSKEDTVNIANIILENRGINIIQDLTNVYMKSPDNTPKQPLRELEASYEIPGSGRFRASIFKYRGDVGLVLRVIPIVVKSFEELNLPPVLSDISNLRRGLVLVTGATGMGKSTTLAAMISYINETRRDHILTIEDPIEFVFKNNKSVITQREVGSDTRNFVEAVKASLRQDPDLIMIGEMRDFETVEVALKASETGHLVFSSLHTTSVKQTIERLSSFFPPEEQLMIRLRLSENLMAIISLRLLPNKSGTGRIPAVEIMRATRTIQECIKIPERTAEMINYMAKSKELGMQTFDQHLLDLVREDKISADVAKAAATSPGDLERSLMLG